MTDHPRSPIAVNESAESALGSEWSIPFPMPALEMHARTFPVMTIGFELVEHLGLEEMATWLRLAMWQKLGEASSLQRLADELWFGDLQRAETWVNALAAKGLIRNGAAYAQALEEIRLFEAAQLPEPPRRADRHEPNDDGTWSGPWPMTYDTNYPPRLQPVVYVLFNDNTPVYVGSTANFRERMKQHHRDKKWTRWTAHPCSTRDEAYRVEAAFLEVFQPALNAQGPQNRSVGGAA